MSKAEMRSGEMNARGFLRRMSPLGIGIALICVLVIGAVLAYHFGARTTPAQPPPSAVGNGAPAVQTARAHRGTLEVTLVTQGRVGPPAGSTAQLAFPQAGIVESVDVGVGDRVSAGQQLATLNRSGLANALAQAQADAQAAAATYAGGRVGTTAANSARQRLDAALARLKLLRAGGPAALSERISAVSLARQAAVHVRTTQETLDRETTLYAGGVVAQKDVQAAHAQLQADLADQRSADAKVAAAGAGYDAAVRQAQSDIALARGDLAAARATSGTNAAQAQAARARVAAAGIAYRNGVLTAPSAGVVVAISKRPGEAVDPSTPVLSLAPFLNHQITLTVPGEDAQRIVVGDPADLKLTASGERSRGRIVAVVPAVDPTTQLSTVVVDGLPPDAVAGQAITATIVVSHASGIVVPSTAIVTDPETGKPDVFVYEPHAKDGPYVERDVTLGATDATSTIIMSGLRVGERIAVQGGYDLLAPAGG